MLKYRRRVAKFWMEFPPAVEPSAGEVRGGRRLSSVYRSFVVPKAGRKRLSTSTGTVKPTPPTERRLMLLGLPKPRCHLSHSDQRCVHYYGGVQRTYSRRLFPRELCLPLVVRSRDGESFYWDHHPRAKHDPPRSSLL